MIGPRTGLFLVLVIVHSGSRELNLGEINKKKLKGRFCDSPHQIEVLKEAGTKVEPSAVVTTMNE